MLIAVITSLIFCLGCKDEPAHPVDPSKDGPVESQPVVPVVDLEPAEVVEPEVSAPVEVKTETPVADVAPVVNKEDKPEESAHDLWVTDYKAAMEKAAAEKKDMLIDFSGSDWCGWCIKLDDEVFSQKEFIEKASKDFVFVMLDFPKDQKLTTPELKAQNEKLQVKYGPEGFPTVYLTDAKGKPYAQTGYQKGGPDTYLEHLSELRKVKVQMDELRAKAHNAKLDGAGKAKLLDEAIRLLQPEWIAEFYREDIEKIIALDSENKAELRDRHKVNLTLWDAGQMIEKGNFTKAIETIDKVIDDFKGKGEIAQEVYYFKAVILDGKGDKPGTLESLKKAVQASPESEMAKHIKDIIKNHFPEPPPAPVPARLPE